MQMENNSPRTILVWCLVCGQLAANITLLLLPSRCFGLARTKWLCLSSIFAGASPWWQVDREAQLCALSLPSSRCPLQCHPWLTRHVSLHCKGNGWGFVIVEHVFNCNNAPYGVFCCSCWSTKDGQNAIKTPAYLTCNQTTWLDMSDQRCELHVLLSPTIPPNNWSTSKLGPKLVFPRAMQQPQIWPQTSICVSCVRPHVPPPPASWVRMYLVFWAPIIVQFVDESGQFRPQNHSCHLLSGHFAPQCSQGLPGTSWKWPPQVRNCASPVIIHTLVFSPV